MVDTIKDKKTKEDIDVVKDFPKVFLNDLPEILVECQLEFHIDIVSRTVPIAKTPYRLTPT